MDRQAMNQISNTDHHTHTTVPPYPHHNQNAIMSLEDHKFKCCAVCRRKLRTQLFVNVNTREVYSSCRFCRSDECSSETVNQTETLTRSWWRIPVKRSSRRFGSGPFETRGTVYRTRMGYPTVHRRIESRFLFVFAKFHSMSHAEQMRT
ncbi:hypothetical protein F5Y15DRAFT_63322 [Xylariaceae sp. FL0016]|nr:hypothetical protein F5Y15DRAFT_63322 [Xylariaceae sp. FL0016]